LSTPGYSKKLLNYKKDAIIIKDLHYEKILCIKCGTTAYLHDPSGGEYGLDFLCGRCARLIHYEEMGMYE